MARTEDVIREVLNLLSPMVEPDGGKLALTGFSSEASRLDVDYIRGSNDACSTCVLDGESLKAFIEEGLQTRGVTVSTVNVHESTPSAA